MFHLQTQCLIQNPGMCGVLCKKRFQSCQNPVWERGKTSPYCFSCLPTPPLSCPYRGRHIESSSSISPYPLHHVHQLSSCLLDYVNIQYVGIGLHPDLLPHSSILNVFLPTVAPLNSLTLPPKHRLCYLFDGLFVDPLHRHYSHRDLQHLQLLLLQLHRMPVSDPHSISAFTTIFYMLSFFFADTFPYHFSCVSTLTVLVVIKMCGSQKYSCPLNFSTFYYVLTTNINIFDSNFM